MISISINRNIDGLAEMFLHYDFGAMYFGYTVTTK